ncbi:hypothetical protein LX36DRAFT_498499 [Colletotrichum falcatum]|nr:hypothetical protein LX36DRAFT_498499 [Colletotrichum falcatum]
MAIIGVPRRLSWSPMRWGRRVRVKLGQGKVSRLASIDSNIRVTARLTRLSNPTLGRTGFITCSLHKATDGGVPVTLGLLPSSELDLPGSISLSGATILPGSRTVGRIRRSCLLKPEASCRQEVVRIRRQPYRDARSCCRCRCRCRCVRGDRCRFCSSLPRACSSITVHD